MVTRRGFGGCVICTAAGLVVSGAGTRAQPAPASGITRTILQSTDLDDRHAAVLVVADIAAGATVARHIHPGIESAYLVEGGCDLSVQGRPDKWVKAGEGFQISAGTPHGVRNGDAPTRLAITYVVEKGKPLASPA